jgi:hypothetical protein
VDTLTSVCGENDTQMLLQTFLSLQGSRSESRRSP